MSDYRYRNNFISAPGDLVHGKAATTGANALSITLPAVSGGKNTLKRVVAELSVTGAQTSLQVQAFDATTNTAAALLWTGNIQPAGSGSDRFDRDDLDIQGTAGNAMFIQMPAPAAGSVQSLYVQTYQTPKTSGN